MPDVTISYKGSQIASMDASGTKTLLTEGKYCEDDITVTYTKPAAPTPEVYAGEHYQPVPVPSIYTVTVSLTNPINPSDFYYCKIWDFTDNEQGSVLAEINSPTGTVDITIPSSITQIVVELEGEEIDYSESNIICTGRVIFAGYTDIGIGEKFIVIGNGTITYDGVDYYD